MTSPSGRLAPSRSAQANLVVDLTCLLAGLAYATFLSGRPFSVTSPELLGLGVAATLSWIVTSTVMRHYDPWSTRRSAVDDMAAATVNVMAAAALVAFVQLAFPETAALPSAPHFIVLLWPVVVIARLFLFRALFELDGPVEDVLVVGLGPAARQAAHELTSRGRKVLGHVAFDGDRSSEASNALGTIVGLEETLRRFPVSEVYFVPETNQESRQVEFAARICERLGVRFGLLSATIRFEKARPTALARLAQPFVMYDVVDAKPIQVALKRLLDVSASAVALVVLSPLLVGTALAVKLTSRGPVFFRQRRVGLYGRTFEMLKFRSMVTNAEALRAKLEKSNEMSGPVFKMRNDPRITSVGRFIRRYSIDELPQLVNVLLGDMSIVGPRPPLPSEVAKYEAWQLRRLSVRPGLTCVWQVSGRNQISFEEWMRMDIRYIDQWSLATDVGLILKTVPVVLTGRGAS